MEEEMSARLTRFKCWWCQRLLGVRRLHHEVTTSESVRRCCYQCYCTEGSNYRKVYADEDQEREEVGRVYEWLTGG